MNEEAENYGRLARKSHFARTLAHYRDLLLRKWWLLGLGAVAGVIAQMLILKFQLPTFVSIGQMIVNVKLAIPQGSMFTEELSNFLGTQAALMQSEIVVNRAYEKTAAATTNASALPKKPALKVTITPRTTIFNLQASGTDPEFTQAFLEECMQEYSRLKREMRSKASESTVSKLTEEVATLDDELRKAHEEIAAFQATNSMVWLEEQGNTLGSYLANLNQRLEAAKSEYDLLTTLTLEQNVRRQDAASSAGAVDGSGQENVTNAIVNNTTLASDYLKAKQQLLLMKAEQQDMGQYLRPKHPKMIAMSEEISRRERLLEIYRQQNAEQLEGRKASVALQVRNLEKEVAEWNARIVEIGRKSAEYQRLKNNSTRIQALHQQLLATMQTLDSNKEVGTESVSIMEHASPAIRDGHRSRNNLVFAALGCIIASLGLLLFVDRLDDRVNSLSDLQELFEDPVLAQIPREKLERTHPRLIQQEDERHGFVEAYRNLRSSILYLPETEKLPRTLLLTSSIPSEGKSMTAANLAIALASAGSRVLLVDADLRKGVLQHRFDVAEAVGLSEVLAGSLPWQEAVKPTATENLSLMQRGRLCSSSGDLFLRPSTRQILKQMAEVYDYVLLDTPPVMAADDVTTLAPHADAVLFVLRAEHTSARVAHAALDLLYQRNARVLGIVFNAVRPSSGDYYYYKYKDYYAAYPADAGKGAKSKVSAA